MSLDEFLAWFSGYTARIKGRPDKAAWSTIRAQIEAMDAGVPLRAWLMGFITGNAIKERPDQRQWTEIQKEILKIQKAIAAEKARPSDQETFLAKEKAMGKGLNHLFKTFGKKA